MSQSMIFHLGGALNERADDEGAMGNRQARYVTGFAGAWPAPNPRGAEHVAWVRNSWETIRPFSRRRSEGYSASTKCGPAADAGASRTGAA